MHTHFSHCRSTILLALRYCSLRSRDTDYETTGYLLGCLCLGSVLLVMVDADAWRPDVGQSIVVECFGGLSL